MTPERTKKGGEEVDEAEEIIEEWSGDAVFLKLLHSKFEKELAKKLNVINSNYNCKTLFLKSLHCKLSQGTAALEKSLTNVAFSRNDGPPSYRRRCLDNHSE